MARSIPLLDLLARKFPGNKRESLFARVLCGEIYVDGEKVLDPKARFPADASIAVRERDYVSRGGTKLQAIMERWKLQVEGLICLDAGASTGGFTDCLLKYGAATVHAVDVGVNQIDYRLRVDPRVILHEKTGIMSVTSLDPRPDFAVSDLSFRSIRGAASHMLGLTSRRRLVALVKPQFEWRNPSPEFRGVVSTTNELKRILRAVVQGLKEEGAFVLRVTESPITGHKGNREFFFEIGDEDRRPTSDIIRSVDEMVG